MLSYTRERPNHKSIFIAGIFLEDVLNKAINETRKIHQNTEDDAKFQTLEQ